MKDISPPEVWMRGPISGIIQILQPVAHALLQASEEVSVIMEKFHDDLLWTTPAGVASVGFHLRHMKGVLDRLFSYSRSEILSEQQLTYLRNEGIADPEITHAELVAAFQNQIRVSIDYLKTIQEFQLTEVRGIGRKQIPTNVLGLLFHAAEHTQRHLGQLLVTAKVLIQ
ncbi:MAG: DinB family protein [Chryseolinea sp.]